MSKKWPWLLGGYVIGSYFGIQHVLGAVGKKSG